MKINEYLKANGMSGKEFALLIGSSAVNVSRYRNGHTKPPQDVMRRIFEVTGGKIAPNDFYDLPTTTHAPEAATTQHEVV